jgi:hypothetical protein
VNEVQIITPPVADMTEQLDFGLVALTEAIEQLDPERVAHGCLGGSHGYGAHWENEVFMMNPYCWCEQTDCLWCTPWLSNEVEATEEESEAHRQKQEDECAALYGVGAKQAPNFWHKRTGLRVNWYKWIGRGMTVENGEGVNVADVMRECMDSLRAPPSTPKQGEGE